MATFYWIAKGTPSGVIDTDGPFNTLIGRDNAFVENNDFWNAAGIIALPFETEGRKLDEARSIAKQLIEGSAAPESPLPAQEQQQQIQRPQTTSFSGTPSEGNVAIQTKPRRQGIVDVAAEEASKVHSNGSGFDFAGSREETGFGGESIDDAINLEVEAADAFEDEIIAPENFG